MSLEPRAGFPSQRHQAVRIRERMNWCRRRSLRATYEQIKYKIVAKQQQVTHFTHVVGEGISCGQEWVLAL